MNRITMTAAALLALTTAAHARPRPAQPPCVETGSVMIPVCVNNNFLAGIRSIKVTMHRERAAPSYGAPALSLAHTGSALVERARSYMGQTAAQIGLRRTLWCSAFMRYVTGASGVDDRAISWNNKPHVAAAVGTIAVMRHHVGVVSGFDAAGNPVIVSGNHGRRVREAVYRRSRVLAFVNP